MGFKISKELTVENILEEISEYDIFNTYCTPFKEIGKYFKSELRVDNTPTCKIFMNEVGDLIYHDFNGRSYNCFTYIEEKFNVDFNTALNIINRDFKLNFKITVKDIETNTKIKPRIYSGKKSVKKVVKLTKKRRLWSKQDKEYWKDKYSISRYTLEYFNVQPLQYYWVGDNRFKCNSITYSYEFSNGFRDIYSPLSKEFKWPASTTKAEKHIYGLDQLATSGNVLFIVSSLKEVMFLFEFGISAIAPQSETVFIPKEILWAMKMRFDRIIIMFDFDKAGCVNAMKNAVKNDINYMKFCPVMIENFKAKDLTDGFEQNKDSIINLLNNYEQYI